jgi:hypothetical protein
VLTNDDDEVYTTGRKTNFLGGYKIRKKQKKIWHSTKLIEIGEMLSTPG